MLEIWVEFVMGGSRGSFDQLLDNVGGELALGTPQMVERGLGVLGEVEVPNLAAMLEQLAKPHAVRVSIP